MIEVAERADGGRALGQKAESGSRRRRAAPFWVAALLGVALCSGAVKADDRATGAIGQIVPASGVVDILGSPGSRIVAVYVHTGQAVKAGELLMLTQGVTASTDPALAKVQLQLAKDLAEQQVTAQSLAVRLAELHRNQSASALHVSQTLGDTLVSKKELNQLRDAAADAQIAFDLERAKLRVITTQARSTSQSAQRQLELATQAVELRAPLDGTVLKISRHVGDQLGNDAAIQIGDLRTMYVVCQVYEGDLLGITPGMKATISAQPLSIPLHGRVEEVGRMIDARARLGEIHIKLDNADPADRLVGMEVEVKIDR